MAKQSNGLWVLTISYNDYDQHGEYFVAVFLKKPTLMELAEFFKYKEAKAGNFMEAIGFLEHLLKGGGRRGSEDYWYHLKFVQPGANYADEQ